MKKLSNLEWTPTWTSLIGCIHGCLEYLDFAPSLDWLFGATGHGLIINMSEDGSCPSGPTAWRTNTFYDLGLNLGHKIDGIFAVRTEAGFADNQNKAWEMTKNAIDQEIPVFGWELAIPEWYVVNGYDDTGYYYNGPGADQGRSPKPWKELGASGIGMLEIYQITLTTPADDKQVVKAALEFALAFNQGSEKWVLPEYCAGLDAYQVWIEAVESGQAVLMGHAYNAAVWEECRRGALGFLQTAIKRLAGIANEPLKKAISAYSEVAGQLKSLTELYPFFENNREEPVGKNPKSEKAANQLRAAMNAEKVGLDHLTEVLERLT